MKYYAAERKKELIPFVTAWVELERIMLSKPGGERQIPYNLTYKWNLINKTNNQNITRDSEIKKKLTVTGGEVGGVMGGKKVTGCQGTCIKDPWTKPMRERTEGGR